MGSRRTEIKRHLPEEEIDEMLREAKDDHHLRRIGFVKNLYQGDTIPEAADRERGRSAIPIPCCRQSSRLRNGNTDRGI